MRTTLEMIAANISKKDRDGWDAATVALKTLPRLRAHTGTNVPAPTKMPTPLCPTITIPTPARSSVLSAPPICVKRFGRVSTVWNLLVSSLLTLVAITLVTIYLGHPPPAVAPSKTLTMTVH